MKIPAYQYLRVPLMLHILEPLALFCELVLHHLRKGNHDEVPPSLVATKDSKVIGSIQSLVLKGGDPKQFEEKAESFKML